MRFDSLDFFGSFLGQAKNEQWKHIKITLFRLNSSFKPNSFLGKNGQQGEFVSIVAENRQQYRQNRLAFFSLIQWLKPLATKISPLPGF